MHNTSSKIHEALRHAEGGLPVIRWLILFMAAMVLFLFFAAGARCSAEEPPLPWHITADKIVNLADDDLLVAEGTVIISREDQILTADRVTYNRRSEFVRAEGNVRLSSAGDILRCERGTFNLNDGTGYLLKGTLFLKANHFYIRGRDMWKTGPDSYFVKDCRITSCDGATPDWSITGAGQRRI